MLTHVFIKNLAVVDELELTFTCGMNVLTGETGAGKSIIIDALGLALGKRGASELVRKPQKQAEVIATFDVSNLKLVKNLLKEHDLSQDDDIEECILRRVLTKDGKSRAYVNGKPSPLSYLKMLGDLLVNIHGQHHNLALFDTQNQLLILDEFAKNIELREKVADIYKTYKAIATELEEIKNKTHNQDKIEILEYKIKELTELEIKPKELEELQQKHKILLKSEDLIINSNSVLTELKQDDNCINSRLYKTIQELNNLKKLSPELAPIVDMVTQANIQIEEAATEIENYISTLETNPEALKTIETRLDKIFSIARKYNIQAENINCELENFKTELDILTNLNTNIEAKQQELDKTYADYIKTAEKLSSTRVKAALKLEKLIVTSLQLLDMPHAKFKINLESNAEYIRATGIDKCEYQISLNPGQPLNSLKKVASGGELSRVSLSISKITSKLVATPTLIFDEVDSGISGKTADLVGNALQELSLDAQILCITHLPQVAAKGNTHFKVAKQQTDSTTKTQIFELSTEARTEEIARMLAGVKISDEALLNAKALLES